MKKFKLFLVIKMFLASAVACLAIPQIPQATLDAASKAIVENKSEVVRVGIGTNDFSTYQYNDITIFGTGDTQIYDNRMLIGNYPANQKIRITLKDGMFNIYSPQSTIPEKVVGPVQVTSNYGLLGVSGLKRAGSQALYHGAFGLIKSNATSFNLVNMIELQEYLKGVVPNEMPVGFGLEALKAQSVAARNYVLSPRVKSSPNYDVVDSVASQVYFGANTENPLSTRAVMETEGVVALYDWDLILALYFSTAGGFTEDYSYAFSDPKTKEFPAPERPYLKGRADIISQEPLQKEEDIVEYYKSRPEAYDVRSPFFRWEREWTLQELKTELQKTLPIQSATGFVTPAFKSGDVLTDIQEIKVLKRGKSGKIVEMEIITNSQKYRVVKELVIRRLLTCKGKALPSANVVFEDVVDENGVVIGLKAFGGGFGHGVGMSQYGAGFMGKELGKTYDEILQHYYSDIVLATQPVIISADETQKTVTQNFYTNRKQAKVIIDNKFRVENVIINVNGYEDLYKLEQGLIKRTEEIDISKHIKKGKNTITFYYPPDEDDKKALRLYVELVGKNEY